MEANDELERLDSRRRASLYVSIYDSTPRRISCSSTSVFVSQHKDRYAQASAGSFYGRFLILTGRRGNEYIKAAPRTNGAWRVMYNYFVIFYFNGGVI